MWANAQRDGHPAEHSWRPLFNAAVWLTPTTRCRAVTLLCAEMARWTKMPPGRDLGLDPGDIALD